MKNQTQNQNQRDFLRLQGSKIYKAVTSSSDRDKRNRYFNNIAKKYFSDVIEPWKEVRSKELNRKTYEERYKEFKKHEYKEFKKSAKYERQKQQSSAWQKKARKSRKHKNMKWLLAEFLKRKGKGYINPVTGYVQYVIHGRTYYEHQLVWLEHNGELPPQGLEINHKSPDGDKTNNDISNLELVTHAQNMAHASRNGLLGKARQAKLTKLLKNMRKN